MLVAIPGLIAMLLMGGLWGILSMVFVVGFAIANIFSIIFSFALKRRPDKSNEISGLLIMGVAGGAIILPIMGMVADKFNQVGAMCVLLLLMIYLLYCSLIVKEKDDKVNMQVQS